MTTRLRRTFLTVVSAVFGGAFGFVFVHGLFIDTMIQFFDDSTLAATY